VTENGFTYMRRSLEDTLQRLFDSPIFSRLKNRPSNPSDYKELVTVLDATVLQELSDLAQDQDMDTGPFVSKMVKDTLQIQVQDIEVKIKMWGQLTAREREVAALACEGMTNVQIGDTLNITQETAKKHMRSILRKFNVKGRGILKWLLDDWNFDNLETPWET